jgi:cellulose synthase/poly-beta-1,6-N-acetylglucosamine synthase-like glycosyltransferase
MDTSLYPPLSMTHPLVSIIIPSLNEEQFISRCLDSIVASDYPKQKLEVLVVDGMSSDNTRNIVTTYVNTHSFIHMVSNPRRITPVAFNVGLDHAHGDLVMFMSAHATYDKDAIRKSVEYSRQYNVDNVGGIWRIQNRDTGLIPRAIVAVLSHPFGVGGAAYRTSSADSRIRCVDTAAFGCYRREVFTRIGRYNEQLRRDQDIELNLRLKHAGGKTLLCPDVIINYSARTSLYSFLQHTFADGTWAVLSFAYSEVMPVAWRHLVPFVFVNVIITCILLTAVTGKGISMLLGVAGVYMLGNIFASFQLALRRRDAMLVPILPLVFCLLHITYGLGSLWGCMQLVARGTFRKLFLLSWRQAGVFSRPRNTGARVT